MSRHKKPTKPPKPCMYCGAPLCPRCREGDCEHPERLDALKAAVASFPAVPGGGDS